MAKLPEKEYGENEFSYREIYFMNGFDEYVDKDNIDYVLDKAVEEIQEDIDEDNDKDSIIGIQAFHFELQHPTELWKKFNVSIYRRRLSMIEKLRTFFFHNYCFHNCFFHNSVGDCMSIDSQFECILRGNIEL